MNMSVNNKSANHTPANPLGRLNLWLLATAVCALSACSTLEGDKIDYRSAEKGRSLEVPPDLTALPASDRYRIKDGGISARGSIALQQDSTVVPAGASSVGDVRVMRSGDKRWLQVQRPSNQIWPVLSEFWMDNGFTISISNRKLGVVETGWAENRAKLPQDFIRETIGKVIDNLYSTGERDKFRTRIESLDGDTATEIYITHRGMVEELAEDGNTTKWVHRASDPELEAEFMRRLMLRMGLTPEQSQTLMVQETTLDTIRLHKNANPVHIALNENFSVAWRRVGMALDRAGFTVTDKDRSKGIFYVRYSTSTGEKTKPGLFGRIFGSSSEKDSSSTVTYLIRAEAVNADNTRLTVRTEGGEEVQKQVSERILQAVYDAF